MSDYLQKLEAHSQKILEIIQRNDPNKLEEIMKVDRAFRAKGSTALTDIKINPEAHTHCTMPSEEEFDKWWWTYTFEGVNCEPSVSTIYKFFHDRIKPAFLSIPSEEEAITEMQRRNYYFANEVSCARELYRWLRDRIKPVERLSDTELSDLTDTNTIRFQLAGATSATAAGYMSGFEDGYCAAEARILGKVK